MFYAPFHVDMLLDRNVEHYENLGQNWVAVLESHCVVMGRAVSQKAFVLLVHECLEKPGDAGAPPIHLSARGIYCVIDVLIVAPFPVHQPAHHSPLSFSQAFAWNVQQIGRAHV